MPEVEDSASREMRVCLKPVSWDLVGEDVQPRWGASWKNDKQHQQEYSLQLESKHMNKKNEGKQLSWRSFRRQA